MTVEGAHVICKRDEGNWSFCLSDTNVFLAYWNRNLARDEEVQHFQAVEYKVTFVNAM